MGICKLHNEIDYICPCSPYREKAIAFHQLCQLHLINTKDFWLFLDDYIETNQKIIMENQITLGSDHHYIALYLVNNHRWNHLYELIKLYKKRIKKIRCYNF